MTSQIKVAGPRNIFLRRPDESLLSTDPRDSGDNLIKKLPFLRKIHFSVNFPAQKMAVIIKDIGEIWTRLFDHRPFLSGELKFFIREFEEKRSDREIEGLFQILENVTDIRDSQTDRVILAAETHLPPLKKSILESVEKCNKILSKEQVYRSDIALERNRELRKAEWESFIQDMSKKCQKVDETFKEKENDIRDFYMDIERKLHISSDLDES